MKYIQFSEKGPRMNNEDSLNIVEIADRRTLFVVCDGMGGHSCGEVASETVCDAFSEYWQLHLDESDSEQKVLDASKVASYWRPLKIWKRFQKLCFLGQPKCKVYICPITGEKQQNKA